jgi:hypothetical protein
VVIKFGKALGKPVKLCVMETASLAAPEITMPTDMNVVKSYLVVSTRDSLKRADTTLRHSCLLASISQAQLKAVSITLNFTGFLSGERSAWEAYTTE